VGFEAISPSWLLRVRNKMITRTAITKVAPAASRTRLQLLSLILGTSRDEAAPFSVVLSLTRGSVATCSVGNGFP